MVANRNWGAVQDRATYWICTSIRNRDQDEHSHSSMDASGNVMELGSFQGSHSMSKVHTGTGK